MRKFVLIIVLLLVAVIAYQNYLLRSNKVETAPKEVFSGVGSKFIDKVDGVKDSVAERLGDIKEGIVLDKIDSIKGLVNSKKIKVQKSETEENYLFKLNVPGLVRKSVNADIEDLKVVLEFVMRHESERDGKKIYHQRSVEKVIAYPSDGIAEMVKVRALRDAIEVIVPRENK